jgi:bifunctional DNA-binding transcriptional regulator/antitoxin component of YhaV-PrlF toxin-antitoxin module
MVIRKILLVGREPYIPLPREIMRLLDWEIKDFIKYEIVGQKSLLLTRLTPEEVKQLLERYPTLGKRSYPDTLKSKIN